MNNLLEEFDTLYCKVNKLAILGSKITSELLKEEYSLKCAKLEKMHANRARIILGSIARLTQHQLTSHITTIATSMLKDIFDDPYKFNIDIKALKNRVEVIPFVYKDGGLKIDPISGAGLGISDIISLALRISLMPIKGSSKILILDEPLKFLSKKFQPIAANLLKVISHKLGIQILIVTHMNTLSQEADLSIQLALNEKKITKVVERHE